MPWLSVKTTRTLLETESQLGKPPEKHRENNLEAIRKQLEKQTAITVIAIDFVVLNYLKRE